MLALLSTLRATDLSEDPLPPLEPEDPPPADWAAWAGVGNLIGVSTAHLESQYDHEGDLVSDHRRSEDATTVFLRLQPGTRFPGDNTLSWRVVEAFGAGTHSSQERSVSRSGGGRVFDYSEQGSYHGPMSLRTDPGLALHLRDGSWSFGTLTEPAQSWMLQAAGRIEENGESRDIDEVLPGGALEGSWIEGVAPKRATSFSGRFTLDSFTPAGQSTQGPGSSRLSRQATVLFWPEVTDVEVVFTVECPEGPEAGFELWRPEGNLTDPGQPGSFPLRVRAVLQARGNSPPGKPLPEVRRFRFELLDTSREPGVCMNWPPAFAMEDPDAPADEDDQFDLRFAVEAPGFTVLSPRRQKAGVRPHPLPGVSTPAAWIRLESFDFGATSRMRVVAELADGREVVGHYNGPGGEEYQLPIPRRDEGTRIAQVWRLVRKVTDGDAADNDDAPVGDGQRGDGFSVYEEYRGFRVDGRHVSPDPAQKDLFVQIQGGLKAVAGPGLRLVEEGTRDGDTPGIHVWDRLAAREMNAARIMNPNRSVHTPRAHSEPQHGLILEGYTSAGANAHSVTSFEPGGLRRPKTARQILIDVESGDLERHVAHEVLHAIGVEHHGVDIGYVRWTVESDPVLLPDGSSRRHFLEQRLRRATATGPLLPVGNPQRITVRNEATNNEVDADALEAAGIAAGIAWVAAQGGEHSGTASCVIRYPGTPPYVPAGGPADVRILPDLQRKFPTQLELDSQGQPYLPRICRRCQGTRMNPLRYGHAEVGDCFHQVCVRDNAPAKPPPKGRCTPPVTNPAPRGTMPQPNSGGVAGAPSQVDGNLIADLGGTDATAWRGWPAALRWVAATNPAPTEPVTLRFADGSSGDIAVTGPGVWWSSPEQSRTWPLGSVVASVGGVEVTFEVTDPPGALSDEEVNRRRRLEIRWALDSGRWEEARGKAAAWIAREPEAPRPRQWLGEALEGLGRSSEALAAFGEAVLRSPVGEEPPPALNHATALLGLLMQALPTRPPAPVRTPQEWDAWFTADPRGRWASAATASSEYAARDYSASQAVGVPDVLRHGDDRRAWASRRADDGPEWLEVIFATPVRASGVRVRQTYNPGAIARIEITDTDGHSTTVFDGVDTPPNPPNQIAWFLAYFEPTTAPVVRVRISLDTARVRGWNEIDAVQLVVAPDPPPAPPAIGAVAYDAATRQIEIHWESIAGARYTIQSAREVSGPWSRVISGHPTGGAPGGPMTYPLPVPGNGSVFLRMLRDSP